MTLISFFFTGLYLNALNPANSLLSTSMAYQRSLVMSLLGSSSLFDLKNTA
ncbi:MULTISPECIES: hypothetical protein [Enterobacterales]|uniref:hypothetical protein n=1 Tax=Enterobacterales TaxID=91347 RepID=UPI002ED871FE